jgi:hypothetical protein
MPVSEQGRSIGLRRRNKLSDAYTSYYDSSNLVGSAVLLLSQSEVVWPLLIGFRLVRGQYMSSKWAKSEEVIRVFTSTFQRA